VLTTQLYFPDEPMNRRDGLFRRELVMRMAEAGDGLAAWFDFVLDVTDPQVRVSHPGSRRQTSPRNYQRWIRPSDELHRDLAHAQIPQSPALPKCASRYKLVRVRLEQSVPSRLLRCRVCKEPLPSTEREYALKYFLIKKGRSGDRVTSLG